MVISTFPYIFLSFPLSYVSLMFILISRTFQSVTLKGGPILLTFALFSRGDIFSRTTFPNLHSHSLFMALWFLCLPYSLIVLGPLIVLKQGPRSNTYSWAFYPTIIVNNRTIYIYIYIYRGSGRTLDQTVFSFQFHFNISLSQWSRLFSRRTR